MQTFIVWLSKFVSQEDLEALLHKLTKSVTPSQVVTWAINLYLDRVGESVDRLAALEMAQRILQSALAAIELEASEERAKLNLLKDQ